MSSRYRWIEPEPVGPERTEPLATRLGLPHDICALLVRRGFADPEAARAFLRPDPSALHPAALLPDLGAAVERLERALISGETVLVHGDYDADGIAAAALLQLGLSELGGRVKTFVPHRTRDGYDLGSAGIARAREVGASLILTADCGVSALDAVLVAAGAGIDVVVTDHHRPGPVLPQAVAVVNPSRADSRYPFAGLAGVGVAFKLLSALWSRAGLAVERLNQHLDLVALGTVADQAPLADENRALVRLGLRALERTRKVGLRALAETAGLRRADRLTAAHIGFVLGPRLNSAGRVGSPEEALRLLVTEDAGEARSLARRLDLQNRRRRSTDREVMTEAVARLETQFEPERDRVVVLWADGWHPGVLGLAASRIVERVHRPTVLVSFDGEIGRGSARSIEGFHLFRALEACGGMLERFGGHAMAAGLDIRRSRIEEFASQLNAYATESLHADALVRRLRLDAFVPLGAIVPEFHRRLEWLAPFGVANPRPVLACRSVRFESVTRVGEGGCHLRGVLADAGGRVAAIGFDLGDRAEEVQGGAPVDVAFQLVQDRWRERQRLQARLLDLRPAVSG